MDEQKNKNKPGIFYTNSNDDIKILSGDNKYYPFDGIIKSKAYEILEIYFDDGTYLECTPDHKICKKHLNKIEAKNLIIGDIIMASDDRLKSIIYIDKIINETVVYDLVNVGPTHTICANDTIVSQCVILDEFAHIESRMADDFYTSVYPVISSGTKTKIFIISTPKGMNLFYKFWVGAENGTNNYTAFEVHWEDVPGRDQKWYEETIAAIGEAKFQQEFNCAFLGSSNTLISGQKLQQLAPIPPKSKSKQLLMHDIDIYEDVIKEQWDDEGKLINIEHKYVICVDTSEGKKLDSSAFTVVDITSPPYKLVAKYKSNIIAPLLYPSIIWQAAMHYNQAYVLIEAMTVGMQVADIMHTDLEYDHIIRTMTGNKKAQTVSEGFKPGSMMGVKTSAPVKRIGCQNLKTLIETDQLLINDGDVIDELTTFVLNNKGSYEAEDGAHDDLVITLVLFAWLSTQTYFKQLVTHDLRKQLRQQYLDFNDEEMLPMLVINNGQKERFLDGFDNDLWTTDLDGSYSDPYEGYFKAI